MIAAVIYSLLYAALAFAWLVLSLHSAPGWAGAFALGYLVVALLLLWGGYFYFRRKNRKLLFHVLAIALAAASLSIGQTWKVDYYLELRQRAETRIWDVRDEPLLSRHGNPLGIRVSYSMLFPKSDYYETDVTLGPESLSFLPAQGSFSNSIFLMRPVRTVIDPPPQKLADGSAPLFEGGVSYHFTVDTLPAFLRVDGGELCTTSEDDAAYKAFPQIDARLTTPYQIWIGYFFDRKFATANPYSPKTFYESALKEGAKHCP